MLDYHSLLEKKDLKHFRTLHSLAFWKFNRLPTKADASISAVNDDWKFNNLEEIKNRLSGWQLKSFNESYKFKVSNGISLFKKNQIKE